jgi:predicted outer membrane repeat protein
MILSDSDFTISKSVKFVSNYASNTGGAIRIEANSQMYINGSIFDGNRAYDSSIIYAINLDEINNITNCIFINNNAGKANGISFIFSKAVLDTNIFMNNIAVSF